MTFTYADEIDAKPAPRARSCRSTAVIVDRRRDDFVVSLTFSGGASISRFFSDFTSAFAHAIDLRNTYDLDGIKVRGVAEREANG